MPEAIADGKKVLNAEEEEALLQQHGVVMAGPLDQNGATRTETPSKPLEDGPPTIRAPRRSNVVSGPQLAHRGGTFAVMSREQVHQMLQAICPSCPRNHNRATSMYLEMMALLNQQEGKAKEAYGFGGEGDAAPKHGQRTEVQKLLDAERKEKQKAINRTDALPTNQQNLAQKAVSLVSSLLGPRCPDSIRDERVAMCDHGGVRCPTCNAWAYFDPAKQVFICRDAPDLGYRGSGCEFELSLVDAEKADSPPCPFRNLTDDGSRHCKKCGCDKNRASELTNKARMTNTRCPRRAEDENGTETLAGAWYISTDRAEAASGVKESEDNGD